MQEMLSYDDVMIVPKYSEIESRSDVDISVELYTKDFSSIKLKVPIIASPMDTVCESEMAGRLSHYGAVGIIHRFNKIEQQYLLVKDALKVHETLDNGIGNQFNCGGAVGINGDFLERTQALVESGCNIICVDVANACSKQAIEASANIRKIIPKSVHLMVGTIGTHDSFTRVPGEIIDSVRVGIGSGKVCKTSLETGVGYNSFQGCYEIGKHRFVNDKQFFADGGLRNVGDIAKAIACGASGVILGSMLAGTKAAPGGKIEVDGKWMKEYRGMASSASQSARGQRTIREEGVSMLIPYKGKVENIINNVIHGLQSSFSYVNSKNIHDFHQKAEFVRVSHAAATQGRPNHA